MQPAVVSRSRQSFLAIKSHCRSFFDQGAACSGHPNCTLAPRLHLEQLFDIALRIASPRYPQLIASKQNRSPFIVAMTQGLKRRIRHTFFTETLLFN